MVFDPITAVNLVLSLAIAAVGYWNSRNSGTSLPLFIAVAFSLFGISHLATLLGYAESLTFVLIVIRTLGYLTVLYALYTTGRAKK